MPEKILIVNLTLKHTAKGATTEIRIQISGFVAHIYFSDNFLGNNGTLN